MFSGIRKRIKECFSAKLSLVFTMYVVVSVVSLLLSNIVVGKSFSFFNIDVGGYAITITSSVIVFPLIYICSDIFSEVYGCVWSRFVSWGAYIMNVLMVIMEVILSPVTVVLIKATRAYESRFAAEQCPAA